MACSKKSWGYLFLGVGIVFFVLGVVCGFVIPKVIIGIVENKACVDSKSDSDYDNFLQEREGRIITRIYYWEITNKDEFLYNGKLPELKERGPYVYKQTIQSIDVSFANNKRSSKTWSKEPLFSKTDSCKSCNENDQITVLNTGYIAMMEQFGSDEAFAVLHLSQTASTIVQQFNHSYDQLGKANQTVWSDPLKSGWTKPGFGAWIRTLPGYENLADFTTMEMKGLYGVLTNTTLLFGKTLENATLKADCEWNKDPAQKDCGFLLHMKAAGVFERSNKKNDVVNTLILSVLCPSVGNQCFNKSDMILKIYPYILHVNRYTMWLMLDGQDELVTTLPQSKIATGYEMLHARHPVTRKLIAVPGVIRQQKTKDDASKYAKESTFYTCEAEEDKKHQWAAYDGQKNLFTVPNMTAEDSIVRGYFLIVPHSETSDKPCTFSHELPYSSLELFVSALAMRIKVRYTGGTSLHGLALKRFTPNKEDFLSHSGVQQGFIDHTKAKRGIPVYLSFAHLLFADINIPKSFNQNPNPAKHHSTIDVEAVTGMLASAFMRIQINLPIKPDIVKVARVNGPLNVTYLADNPSKLYLKSIPVLWGEYGAEATVDEIDLVKKKVIGMLGLACGILIAFPILGAIFIVIAIALFVVITKANRISEFSSK